MGSMFQRQRNVDVWSPQRFNVEMTLKIQCRNDIEQIALNRLLEEKILSKCKREAEVSVISCCKFRSYNDLTWTPHRKTAKRIHRYFILFWKCNQCRVIQVELMSSFLRWFIFQSSWNIDELSVWNVIVEPIANRRKIYPWESTNRTFCTNKYFSSYWHFAFIKTK